MKKVSIILPVYNGETYLEKLISKIRIQNYNGQIEIIAAVSKSTDNSYELARKLCDIAYIVENFNHAKTRHEAALLASGEVLVFITQDILPYNNEWLTTLVGGLKNDVVATYSQQVPYPEATCVEKLTREFNYPNYPRKCNKHTSEQWGRKNIYYSDSASATLKEPFIALGGYDFNIGTNEDVVYACNVINDGKSILYNNKSIVYHSHNLTIKELIARYKAIGKFEAEHQNLLSGYSSNGEGVKLVKHVIKQLIKDRQFLSIFEFILKDCVIRLVSYKIAYFLNTKIN